jgi:uncharacterized GH25 family protein
MKKFVMMVAAVVLVAGLAVAQDVRLLTANEAVAVGATHAVTLEHTDLTTATTNTAQTFNVPMLAKQGVQVVGYVLETAFVDTATNANNTLTLTVGDGSDADLLLTSTEMASDGTEVYLKFPAPMVNSGQATNVTLLASSKVYTADGNMVLTVTPGTDYAVSAFDAGKVTLYVRILDAVKRLR